MKTFVILFFLSVAIVAVVKGQNSDTKDVENAVKHLVRSVRRAYFDGNSNPRIFFNLLSPCSNFATTFGYANLACSFYCAVNQQSGTCESGVCNCV